MKATLFAVVVPMLLAGCTTPSSLPEVLTHKSPVKASAEVPKTHHHSTLTGYIHREPAAPEAWVTEEDAAAPDAGATIQTCKKVEGASDDCPIQ